MAGFSVTTSTTICALLIFFAVCYLPTAGSVFFNYTFNQGGEKDIRIEGDASFSVGSIDISANKYKGIDGSRGWAFYDHPVPLWESTTGGGEVASFTTRFSFIIDPPGASGINNKGSGMAFFLAAYPSTLPVSSPAYNLGLTNESAGAVVSGDGGRFVAVEFDTFNDTAVFDPDTTYDHLGIDVNSVRSVNTLSLQSFSLIGNMSAEIEYNNVSSILSVMLWLGDGRNQNYSLSSKVDLKSALPKQVVVGFSAATSTSIELHQLLSWYFNSSLEPKAAAAPAPAAAAVAVAAPASAAAAPPPPPSGRGGVIAGATAGAALFLVLLFAMATLFVRRWNKKKRQAEEEIGSEGDDGEPVMEIEMERGPRRFPYHELVDATRNFAAEEKLGQGGFGAVYRGYLPELSLAVAIKRFSKESSMQGMKEYKSEIKVISRLRHRNLVQLIGWCHGRDELLLVYELVPNRSLDVHLYSKDTLLTWPLRVKIVLGGLCTALPP